MKKKQQAASGVDRMMEKKERDKESKKYRDDDKRVEEKRKEDKRPKYYRDIRPTAILGVTTEPGELCFYVKWDSGMEPGLVTAKEAYQKMPQMCLKYYESKLIWRDKPPKTKEEVVKDEKNEKEMVNGIENVKISKDDPEKPLSKPTENGSATAEEVKKSTEVKPASSISDSNSTPAPKSASDSTSAPKSDSNSVAKSDSNSTSAPKSDSNSTSASKSASDSTSAPKSSSDSAPTKESAPAPKKSAPESTPASESPPTTTSSAQAVTTASIQ